MKSFLEVVQHISKPSHVIHQLHNILRVHSRGARQVRREAHAAQGVGRPETSYIPGFSGSSWKGPCVGLIDVLRQALVVFSPAATTTAAAIALPEHPSSHNSCHPSFWGGTAGQLAPDYKTLPWSLEAWHWTEETYKSVSLKMINMWADGGQEDCLLNWIPLYNAYYRWEIINYATICILKPNLKQLNALYFNFSHSRLTYMYKTPNSSVYFKQM